MSRLAVIIAAIFLTSNQAYAYLDPGTGSLLLQGLIAGVAAGWAIIQLNYARLKSLVTSWRVRKSEPNRKNFQE